MADWKIQKPLGQCCATGRVIEPGREYFAALVESEEGLQRQDFCAEYWDEHHPAVYCYWKSKLPERDDNRQIFVDDEMLIAFFDRLGTENEPERINFRFVLMLILMRKKKLKYDSSSSADGKELWRLRVTRENRFVEVVNPHLDDEQIEELSGQLGQILQVEL